MKQSVQYVYIYVYLTVLSCEIGMKGLSLWYVSQKNIREQSRSRCCFFGGGLYYIQ